jgi:hypothetical protein
VSFLIGGQGGKVEVFMHPLKRELNVIVVFPNHLCLEFGERSGHGQTRKYTKEEVFIQAKGLSQ